MLCIFKIGNVKLPKKNNNLVDGSVLRRKIEYVSFAIPMLVMNSIMFLNVHLYLLTEICIYLDTIKIEEVGLLFTTTKVFYWIYKIRHR